MATVMASSCSFVCPCSSLSPCALSSTAVASVSPTASNAGIVSRSDCNTLSSADCACHRHQRQNQQRNSAPFFVPPPALSARRKTLLPCPRADLDPDTILAVGAAVAGVAVGIGIPVFYETQVKGSEERENDQPCFPCNGSGSQTCRFCVGAGNITVDLGLGEKEVSKCINCEGVGSITCTTCQGSGVQPRYLDRREYKDED